MEELIKKYADKLVAQGLCEKEVPLIGGLDVELIWNRDASEKSILEEVFSKLNINSLLFAPPKEPYFSILNYLAKKSFNLREKAAIYPEDCETRTFLHNIPVIKSFKSLDIVLALKQSKCVVIPDYGIVTWGTISPEQAFVFYSSVCFSAFVKFFTDYLYDYKKNKVEKEQLGIFNLAAQYYQNFMRESKDFTFLQKSPFNEVEEVIKAMVQAGKLTVDCGMVDSFFGNISFRLGDTIYISQTGSSLDELAGYIDPCPLDGSTCSGITASSELAAHREIFLTTNNKSILHGHPRFCVIMSMFCPDKDSCVNAGRCHIKCTRERFIADIPVVPGEVGTGPTGLCNTLPKAIKGRRGAIVYGHGLFTTGKEDFTDAFSSLMDIEKMCMEKYFSFFK